jgi:hypothetical protein
MKGEYILQEEFLGDWLENEKDFSCRIGTGILFTGTQPFLTLIFPLGLLSLILTWPTFRHFPKQYLLVMYTVT